MNSRLFVVVGESVFMSFTFCLCLDSEEMEVKARAPGKIILAGEHAVVHGSTAVAAAIDLYTYVTLRLPLQSGSFSYRILWFWFSFFFLVVNASLRSAQL